MLTMFCDHLAKVLIYPVVIGQHSIAWLQIHRLYLQSYDALTFVGKVTFPIFAFFIVEGFFHTKNLNNYIKRLFGLTIISEIPFDLATSGKLINLKSQNVIWTLLLGLLIIVSLQNKERWLGLISSLGLSVVAYFLKVDWGVYPGILLIVVFYLIRGNKKLLPLGYLLMIPEVGIFSGVELAFVLLALYNGNKGRINSYACYIFYPLHLLLLGILRLILI
jgi:hypothetical protein